MNKQEKRELMLRFAAENDGAWPEGYDALIVSTEKNIVRGDGKYQNFTQGKAKFDQKNVSLRFWKWVCTRVEYEAMLQELADAAPEGATHYSPRSKGFYGPIYLKNEDGEWQFTASGLICWHLVEPQSVIGERKLIPLPEKVKSAPVEAEWAPKSGELCMAYSFNDGEFIKAYHIGNGAGGVMSKAFSKKQNSELFWSDRYTKMPAEESDSAEPKKEWMPEVGVECWCYPTNGGDRFKVMPVVNDNGTWVVKSLSGTENYFGTAKDVFRPLETEREKFIDQAISDYLAQVGSLAVNPSWFGRIFGAMFDAGYTKEATND